MIFVIAFLYIDPFVEEENKKIACESNYEYNKIIYLANV